MKSNIIVDCKNGHTFRLGLTDDGLRDCPDCGELLSNPKEGANTFGLLTIGQAWRNKRKAERMQSKGDKASSLSITVDMNTDKMQLKLRAIAKHCEALANELDAIDNTWQCPNCNASDYDDYFANDDFRHRVCNSCQVLYDKQSLTKDDLPTHLEGSD